MNATEKKMVALFDTRKANVRVHAADCAMLNRAGWKDGQLVTARRGLVAFEWSESVREEEDLDAREIPVAYCKCTGHTKK
jgi:hypothetical protein